MIRTETYLDGRLVKQFDMVNVGPTADKPWPEWVDGHHTWLLDGEEIGEADALDLIGPDPVTSLIQGFARARGAGCPWGEPEGCRCANCYREGNDQ